MRHDHYVHIPELVDLVRPLLKALDRIRKQGETIMAALDELRKQTAEGFATVAEIAGDIDDLIKRLAEGQPGSQEVADATAEATALTAGLKEVAAKYTPPTP